jgi:hypothetical protein
VRGEAQRLLQSPASTRRQPLTPPSPRGRAGRGSERARRASASSPLPALLRGEVEIRGQRISGERRGTAPATISSLDEETAPHPTLSPRSSGGEGRNRCLLREGGLPPHRRRVANSASPAVASRAAWDCTPSTSRRRRPSRWMTANRLPVAVSSRCATAMAFAGRTVRYVFKQRYKHGFAISQRNSPELCPQFPYPLIQRAQGMPGARCAR